MVTSVLDLVQALGSRSNLGGYCYNLIYHEKRGGEGTRTSRLQTFTGQ